MTYWEVNGFPARVVVWSAALWKTMPRHPPDARRAPDGSWHALRVD